MRSFNFNSILIPVNFSVSSLNAAETGGSICRQVGARATLLQVIDNSAISFTANNDMIPVPICALAAAALINLRKLSLHLREKYEIECDCRIETGIPSAVICSLSEERKFDLVVIGQNENATPNEFLSSSAYRIVKNALCPVLSVPSQSPHINFRKIMFPVRNAPRMLDKYALIRILAKQNNASIIIAGVTNKYDAKARHIVGETLNRVCKNARRDHLNFSAQSHHCENTAHQILKLSRKETVDLIVITTQTMQSLKRVFLEHYSKNIVRLSRCPVLSLRADAQTAG